MCSSSMDVTGIAMVDVGERGVQKLDLKQEAQLSPMAADTTLFGRLKQAPSGFGVLGSETATGT